MVVCGFSRQQFDMGIWRGCTDGQRGSRKPTSKQWPHDKFCADDRRCFSISNTLRLVVSVLLVSLDFKLQPFTPTSEETVQGMDRPQS